MEDMQVQFLASVSVIVKDMPKARDLYTDVLKLRFEGKEGDYSFTEKLSGIRHFGLWPLQQASVACFGTPDWPENLPVPSTSLEFEVEDVATAATELEERGYKLLHSAKVEPWGQVTARLLTAEGVLIAVCYTPWFHEGNTG